MHLRWDTERQIRLDDIELERFYYCQELFDGFFGVAKEHDAFWVFI